MIDDQQLKQATARVSDSREQRGTAWYCGANLALTAAHVVGDLELRKTTREPLWLEFPGMAAKVVEIQADFDLDIAMLRLETGSVGSTDLTPLPIADPYDPA